jgi:hypothetical protein
MSVASLSVPKPIGSCGFTIRVQEAMLARDGVFPPRGTRNPENTFDPRPASTPMRIVSILSGPLTVAARACKAEVCWLSPSFPAIPEGEALLFSYVECLLPMITMHRRISN